MHQGVLGRAPLAPAREEQLRGSIDKWQPKVSDFTLTPNDDRTVVDIAEALSHDKDVEAAWPDVLGSFKRE